MQYDYGLRQGRSRPLANRPDTFVSAEGKVIAVDKKVAEVNEGVLENGRVRADFFHDLTGPFAHGLPVFD
jgi:exonuclease V